MCKVHLRDVVEMLDKGSEGVAVGRDQELLARLDDRHQRVVPQWHEALYDASERLRNRQLRIGQKVVLLLLARMELVISRHGRRRSSVGSAPDENLGPPRQAVEEDGAALPDPSRASPRSRSCRAPAERRTSSR